MRDHSVEADIQHRSESRTGGSAASCSHTEKRPLNNNILINAPLPYSVATGSNRWRVYWKLERRVTEQGPLWAPARPTFTVCFLCEFVGRVWFCEHWDPADLLPPWKQPRLEGPLQEVTIKGVTSHQSLSSVVPIIRFCSLFMVLPQSAPILKHIFHLGEKKISSWATAKASHNTHSHQENITAWDGLPQTSFYAGKTDVLIFR